jgi:thiol-disulfide isomerase/thioredoxin
MKKTLILISLILGSTFSLYSQGPESKTLKIGDKAPNLVNIQKWIQGKPVPQFEKGKVYLVDISMIACPGCVKIIPQLKDIADKYRGKVEVIVVYVAGKTAPEFLEKFVNRISLNYTVAMDTEDGKTNKEWGVSAYPTTFIINQEERIASYGHSDKEVESVLNTGKITSDLIKEKEFSENDRKELITGYIKQMNKSFQDGGYKGRLHYIDSLLPHVTDEIKYDGLGLMMSKYETLLQLNDSIAADECLKDQMAHTPEGSWYYLVSYKFNNYVPSFTRSKKLRFNYQRFLDICERAANEMNGSFRFISRYLQAIIMYRYDPDHNKEAALDVLNKAEKEDPERAGDFRAMREQIEQLDKKHQQANADWNNLEVLIDKNLRLDLKIQEGRGYSEYILNKERLARKILAGAADFWDKYRFTGDNRRMTAFSIYSQAHKYNLMNWVDTAKMTKELSARIDEKYQQEKILYKQGQSQGKQIATGPPLFRMIPRDMAAEKEWRLKRDEMTSLELNWAISMDYCLELKELKEKIEWENFVSNWGQAYSLWNELPARDERPDMAINGVEDSYWKLLAIHYWEATWMSFKHFLERYAGLPIIADRALDFLGAMAGAHNTDEVVKDYWKELAGIYGNPKHPLAGKDGIVALVKLAQEQFNAYKANAGERVVELDPFIALDGRRVDLAEYRGKVVLIDFWATWCKPCVESIPELKIIYDKYHDKGLEIIGISLDNKGTESRIKQIIEKQGLAWPQRFTGKGMNDTFAKLYGINALPTVWLLDKDGKIVDQNSYGERLENLIKEYIR